MAATSSQSIYFRFRVCDITHKTEIPLSLL